MDIGSLTKEEIAEIIDENEKLKDLLETAQDRERVTLDELEELKDKIKELYYLT